MVVGGCSGDAEWVDVGEKGVAVEEKRGVVGVVVVWTGGVEVVGVGGVEVIGVVGVGVVGVGGVEVVGVVDR